MNQPDERDVRMLRVVWIAIVNSILVYFALMYFFIRPQTPRPVQEALRQMNVQVLYGAGLVSLIASGIVFRMLLRAEGGRVAFPRIKLAYTVRWAIIESIAIFGLLAAFISQSPAVFVPPAVVALTAILMAFPSDDAISSYSMQ